MLAVKKIDIRDRVASNLKRLRKEKGFTQQHLAKQTGLSVSAYRGVEKGEAEPEVSCLRDIAVVLEVPIQRLVEHVHQLKKVRFRSNKKMLGREQILVDAARWLHDFCGLEDLLNNHVSCVLKDVHKKLGRGNNRVDKAVRLVREAAGLRPDEPVWNMRGLLEALGFKVGEQKVESHDFFGLSIADNGEAAIVVNTLESISVERWIFTAAHELGHLILHQSDYDVAKTAEEAQHEKEADAFASFFLMPDNSFQKEWHSTWGLPLVDRVLRVKRIFNVSYKAVLYRCQANYRGNIWRDFQLQYAQRYGHTLSQADEPNALDKEAFQSSPVEDMLANEPTGLSRIDFTQNRLPTLVCMAIEQQKISISRGAEIMGISLYEMRDLASSWVAERPALA